MKPQTSVNGYDAMKVYRQFFVFFLLTIFSLLVPCAVSTAPVSGDIQPESHGIPFILNLLLTGNIPAITIEYPPHNGITAHSVPVKGKVKTPAQYVEISVNNRHALVVGNEFLVPDLALEPGENSLTVHAVDSNGKKSQTKYTVIRSEAPDWLELQLDKSGGFAPLETRLTIVPHLEATLKWDTGTLEGRGPTEVTIKGTAEQGYQLTFAKPGLYTLDFQIQDVNGAVHQERTFVSVLQPFAAADWLVMNEGVQQFENNFTALLVTMDVDAARQQVLEQARSNHDFSSSTLSSGALCLVFRGLIPVILDLRDPNAPPVD